MNKKLFYCLLPILYLFSPDSVFGQKDEKWMIVPYEEISKNIIDKYNKAKDKEIQYNEKLRITASPKNLGDSLFFEIKKIEVVATEGSTETEQEIMSTEGKDKPQEILGAELLNKIGKKNYLWDESKEIRRSSNLLNSGRCRDVYWWTPAKAELSIYQIIVRITDKVGFEFKLGDDELGFPFWTSGIFKVGVNHQNLRVFFLGPHGMGTSSSSIMRGRMLEGALGGGISFDMDNWGGRVSFSDMTRKNADNQFVNDKNVAFIPFAFQGYYTWTIPIAGTFSGSLRIKTGGGYHQVLKNSVDAQNNLTFLGRDHYYSPYLRFDYTKDEIVEAFVQYYNTSIVIGTAYNFADWFSLEAKFALWNLTNDTEKWQPSEKNFLIISPRIRFKF